MTGRLTVLNDSERAWQAYVVYSSRNEPGTRTVLVLANRCSTPTFTGSSHIFHRQNGVRTCISSLQDRAKFKRELLKLISSPR